MPEQRDRLIPFGLGVEGEAEARIYGRVGFTRAGEVIDLRLG